MRRIFILLFILFIPLQIVFAGQTKIKHVIYVTLDGVRWQDILLDRQYFPKLWKNHAKNLQVYGMPGDSNQMEAASIPVSLPSYQAQMTGAVQKCVNNDCGRVHVKTMPENIKEKLKLDKIDVAVFSSWPEVDLAAESEPGQIFSNAGNSPVIDPITFKPDPFMQQINKMQKLRHHVKTNRIDEYTFRQALHYLSKYQPKFLWISLVNGDNEAHDGNLQNYRATLKAYDSYLDELFTAVDYLGMNDNTLIIVTTDHGRGSGHNWTEHGPKLPETKKTWAFVKNGKLEPAAGQNGHTLYSTLSIRPTIEHALGIIN